jgi:agmatinase
MREHQTLGRMYGSSMTTTFMGLPAGPDLASIEADVVLIGIPAATPYPSVGSYCAAAPEAIRLAMADYAAALHHHDFDLDGPLLPPGARLVDAGDLPVAKLRDDVPGHCQHGTGSSSI